MIKIILALLEFEWVNTRIRF